jgi:hypothetical protein
MLNKTNRDLVDYVFNSINSSKKITIPDELKSSNPSKNKYPRDILDWLQQHEKGFIDKLKNLDLSKNGTLSVKPEQLENEISKLLYIMVWKQGDLKKFKGIINGLTSAKEDKDIKEPFVFYQLGRHIAHGEPMIDQHVLRAFKTFIQVGKLHPEEFSNVPFAKMDKEKYLIKSNKKSLIEHYLNWVKLKGSKHHKISDIDNIMFALGKFLKSEFSKK